MDLFSGVFQKKEKKTEKIINVTIPPARWPIISGST